MKKIIVSLIFAQCLTVSLINAQEQVVSAPSELVGYGGGRFEVFKTGSQESIQTWFKWIELHLNEDVAGILEMAHDNIYIEVADGTVLNGKEELKVFLETVFESSELSLEQRWAVPLRFVEEDGSVRPGDWIVNNYQFSAKSGNTVTIEDSESNAYIIGGLVRYIKIYTHSSKTAELTPVTFSVDLSSYGETFKSVSVFGTFNDWCATCTTLEDNNNDGVYTVTVEVPVGAIQYKFTLDQQTVEEQLKPGTVCTQTTGNFTNRIAQIEEETVLPIVCFNSCDSCQ